MKIKNLINSPYKLVDAKGKTHILPVGGEIDIEPHPMHAGHYKQASFLELKELPDTPANDGSDPRILLREEYAQISGVSADKRWSETRLRTKIDSLMESQT